MNVFSNFKEFYVKSLIPMSKEEQHIIEQGIFKNDDFPHTHWLFALIGEPKELNSQVFHWKVAIYPSSENRRINFEFPFYLSDPFNCIDTAYEFVKTLEEKARDCVLLAELDKKNNKMA